MNGGGVHKATAFPDAILAAVLATPTEDVFIFNIQNDTDVSSNILNVTFSALLPGGTRGRFFPSEDLQEQALVFLQVDPRD